MIYYILIKTLKDKFGYYFLEIVAISENLDKINDLLETEKENNSSFDYEIKQSKKI